jgi:hypothetical protein
MNVKSESGVSRLLETVADIGYMAGSIRYYSGDSREDVQQFIAWANEFETRRRVHANGMETYGDGGVNYMLAIEQFTMDKLGDICRHPK